MITLYNISNNIRAILNAIAENDGEVTPELDSQLAISQADLQQKGINYALAIREMKAREEAIDTEIKRLQGLKKAAGALADNLKSRIQIAMTEFEVEKIESDLVKLSFRKSKETVIDDEDQLPASCFITERKVVKAEVKRLIESGTPIAGARIVEKRNLQIK